MKKVKVDYFRFSRKILLIINETIRKKRTKQQLFYLILSEIGNTLAILPVRCYTYVVFLLCKEIV